MVYKKKKHHYVPRGYLKFFSNDDISINQFNKKNEVFHKPKIRDIARKNNLYGKTNDVENSLEKLENMCIEIIKKIRNKKNINLLTESQLYYILSFVLLQYSRTYHKQQEVNNILNNVLNFISGGKFDDIIIKSKGHFLRNILNSLLSVPLLLDMEFILLRNKTNKSFITSDNPVVFFNSYYRKKRLDNLIGIASSGLQIFFPISRDMLLFLFDPECYYIKTRELKEFYIDISNHKDIEMLNNLQFINSEDFLYYSNDISADEIKKNYDSIKGLTPKQKIGYVHEKTIAGHFYIHPLIDFELSFICDNEIVVEKKIRNKKTLELHESFIKKYHNGELEDFF